MSINITACYGFQNTPVHLLQARAFLEDLDIHYAGTVSHYVLEPDDYLDELLGLPPGTQQVGSRFSSLEESWNFFAQAVESGVPSLNCNMRHKEFQFTLGFVAAPRDAYILLDFESNATYAMGVTLPLYGLDARQFYTRLFQAFAAQSFVYVIDTRFENLLRFLRGTASCAETEESLRMAIAIPNTTADMLRSVGGQDLLIEGTNVISRDFFGASDLV